MAESAGKRPAPSGDRPGVEGSRGAARRAPGDLAGEADRDG
jgi:hypothetical protein